MEKRRVNIFYMVPLFLFVACGQQEIKFDKEKWNERDDFFYAYRERMVNDLMENYLKKGVNYKEVIHLLGSSENYQDISPNTIGYEIKVDYGRSSLANRSSVTLNSSSSEIVLNFSSHI